jgi:hypothetical protein
MKYVKTLGLLTVAAAALMAFAATASATTLTDKTNAAAPYEGHIQAVFGKSTWIGGPSEVSCSGGGITAKVKNKGGPKESETVALEVVSMAFSECGSSHVTVNVAENYEIHTDKVGVNDGNGTATMGRIRKTIQNTSIGLSCEYEALAVDIGTIDGSRKTVGGKHPTAVVTTGAKLPRVGGSFFCGTSVEWLAEWTITTPDYLDVD